MRVVGNDWVKLINNKILVQSEESSESKTLIWNQLKNYIDVYDRPITINTNKGYSILSVADICDWTHFLDESSKISIIFTF